MEVFTQLLQRHCLVVDGNNGRLHCHWIWLRHSLAIWLDRTVSRMDQLYHVSSKVAYTISANIVWNVTCIY